MRLYPAGILKTVKTVKITAKKAKPAASARTITPLTAAQKLDAVGIEAICGRIESGEDDGTIAKTMGMHRMSLRQWIKARGHDAAISSAREESAEAWLDEGLNTIRTALPKGNNIDSGAARAYAQECARRAAIRNPRYREKLDVVADVTMRELSDDQLRAKAEALALKIGLANAGLGLTK